MIDPLTPENASVAPLAAAITWPSIGIAPKTRTEKKPYPKQL